MKLIAARVRNYKCFSDTGEVKFSSSFNTFIGPNDVGKSALFSALSLQFESSPNRTIVSAPRLDDMDNPSSEVELTYQMDGEFIRSHFSKQQAINLPPSRNGQTNSAEITLAAFDHILKNGDDFTCVWRSRRSEALITAAGYFHTLNDRDHQNLIQFLNAEAPYGLKLQRTGNSGGQSYYASLAQAVRDRTYAFRAERLNLAKTASVGGHVLMPDASNLGEVLNNMSTDVPYLYNKLLCHVRTIFPHITEIKAVLQPSRVVDIRVSTVDPSLSRHDLAFSLSDSGTGIGQVLAMLYVVVRNTSSHIIFIDEPNSFLHPGAVRKLIEIFRQYPQHQYFVTTHSSSAINVLGDDRMFHISRSSPGVVIERVERADELKSALADIGVRLSDVFGAESIMWVEGLTEEVCFPHLISEIARTPLQGVVVLGVINTGDFDARTPERVIEVYEKLSTAGSLLPRASGFIFDRELRCDQKMNDLSRRAKGAIYWLPLRMFENYLIEPEAIAHVINEVDSNLGGGVDSTTVHQWIVAHGLDLKYVPQGFSSEVGSDDWMVFVHGASLLNDVFSHFTAGRYDYDKVRHGEMLTLRLAQKPTELIRSLAGKLADIIKASWTS